MAYSPSWILSMNLLGYFQLNEQHNRAIKYVKCKYMFMSHRQTGCHREYPRGRIGHDEYHVFWALDHFDRSSMTYTFPVNKWTFSLWTKHKNQHKHAHTLPLSQRLNCSSFDLQLRVQSPSKHCRNLHDHHKESSIPWDIRNLKSFITFYVFSRTYPCCHSKLSWQRQLALYLTHSAQLDSQIISLSFYTLFLYPYFPLKL